MSWIASALALIGKLFDWLTEKDERDISHVQGEKLGVAETQAATAQHAVQEAQQSAQTQDDVHAMTDAQLDAELKDGPK